MADGATLAALIVAGTGVLGTIGGGIKFIWGKVEKRFQAIEAQLLECRANEQAHAKKDAVKLTVIELLWYEVRTHNPGSAVLERARNLMDSLKLDRAFPVERSDLTAMAEAIDRINQP